MVLLYNILMTAGLTAAMPLAVAAAAGSRKRRRTVIHRLGLGPLPDPPTGRPGRPVWVHALSVGEVRSARPLVAALAQRIGPARIVGSAATLTGYREAAAAYAPAAGRVIFSPFDLLWSVRRMAARIDPALVIVVESDVWPNFLHEMGRRRVPVVLVNARLSDRSLAGYRRLGRFGRTLFGGFGAICTQSQEDARRFRSLGIDPDRVHVTGSTKFDQHVAPVDSAKVGALRRRLGLDEKTPVLVAGSTHAGEEAGLAKALKGIRARVASTALIVAPRNPERAAEVCRIFTGAGFVAHPLSRFPDSRRGAADVVVVDALGQLVRLYALADLAFVGGSLVRQGGHNPLEPAALARPVLFGPDMGDFRRPARLLIAAGGGRQVRDAEDLARQAATLLSDPDRRRSMGSAARGVFMAHRGAVARTLAVIRTVLPKDNPVPELTERGRA